MDRLKQRLVTAKRALQTFHRILGETKSDIVRDAAIQRFEYTFEAVWKTAQLYMKEREGLDLGSPKAVIRGFAQLGLLSEQQIALALAMADDRNLTVHTYNESLAEELYGRLPNYAKLMGGWLHSMSENSASLWPQ